MSFPINVNIPNAPNNPANDQPIMKQNYANISGFLAVDHVAPGTINDGYHQQVHLLNEAAPGIGTASGVLYANLASGNSWPFWQNALGSFNIIGPNSLNDNGYAFFGPIVIQWGFVASTLNNTNGTVTFAASNIAFPNNCFVVNTTPVWTSGGNPNSRATIAVENTALTLTKTSFNWSAANSSVNYGGFFWIAIGN